MGKIVRILVSVVLTAITVTGVLPDNGGPATSATLADDIWCC